MKGSLFLRKTINYIIQPLLAQPSSRQHQQQQPQRPQNFLPFLRPQNSIQKKRERKLKEVNQCQVSTRRQQVSTPVLVTRGSLQNSVYWRQSQLNRNHFFQDGVANEAGSEKQWTCFWGVFVLVLYLQETNLRERKFS